MSTSFTEAQFYMPSVRRFFSEIGNDLASPTNVLGLLPQQIAPADVSAVLFDELERRTFDCRELRLSSTSLDRSPEALTCRYLGIELKSQDPEDLISALHETPNLPRVLFLKGLCEMEPAEQRE